MTRLEMHNLHKKLGGNTVLNDVSLTIEDSEFLVLLGASGSGKSTLLRIVCGLEQPDSGQVLIDGRDVTKLPARERNLGMVFQDYGLYPNMNVQQNIAYGLEARGGLSKSEIEQRVVSSAQKLGLGELLKRAIVDLSGGEQQRVALARAMAKDANAYLYDEPLSNLDPKLRYQARRDIINVHRQKSKPSLYVTHDQTEAFAMADRIALLAKGKMQQVGSTDVLLSSPANMYVAQFLGSPPMNLVWGGVKRENGHFCINADGVNVILPDRWTTPLNRYAKDRVVLGLRPDALLATDAPSWSPNGHPVTVDGQVEDVESLIGETVVRFKVGRDITLSALFEDTDAEIVPGQSLRVGIDTERIVLFDPDTEQALSAA